MSEHEKSDGYYDIQCPLCAEEGYDSAEDNLRVYDSGVAFCYVRHGYVKHLSEKTDETVVEEVLEEYTGGMLDGVYGDLKGRGVNRKTCEFYGYKINRDHQLHLANFYDAAGQLVMQQHRDRDKNFAFYGDKSFTNTLYGQWLFSADDRVFCTITEGMIDCLSVAQAFDCKYPVLSLPNGAAAAKKVLEANLKYLSGFKYIVLAFDNDRDGQKATENCLKILGPGKIRVAKWRLKDANDLLQQGLTDEIRKTVYNAVEYVPAPILTGEAFLECLRGHSQKTQKWPWAIANEVIAPMYTPAVYTFAALPGVGKTVVMADIMRDAIARGQNVGVISLEEASQKLLLKITDMITGSNLRDIKNRQLTDDEIELARPIAEKIVTYDHSQYGSDIDTILENLPYIAQALKCEIVIFDNLSFSVTGAADDERKNLDKAMLKLKSSSTSSCYTLFNICHLNDDKDDFRDATMRGSRGMMMYSDQVIYLGRDTESQDPDDRNTLIFYVKKDRESGMDTGKEFSLKYDPALKRFVDGKVSSREQNIDFETGEILPDIDLLPFTMGVGS